jgi:single-stranded DNA-binding protein
VIVCRDQAEDAAESLAKGSRVVVVGRLQQRSWSRKDGRAFYQTRLMSSGTPVPTQGTGGWRPLLPRSHPAGSTVHLEGP